MKAFLSVSYSCVLAAMIPGLSQAAAPDPGASKPEVALQAADNPAVPPTITGNAATPPDAPMSSPAPSPTAIPDVSKSLPAPSVPVSQNLTINLINRLVQRGVLTKDDADGLIKQAEADTAKAHEQASTPEQSKPADATAPDATLFPPNVLAPSANDIALTPTSTPSPEDSSDEVRVPYVPEIVRRQIAEEVREEVMQKARAENWADPRTLPAWILRLTPFADFRLRYEGFFFPNGNDNTGAFPNFNAINTGAPFDTTGTTFSPQLNVDNDRNRFRIRVRFGAQMDLEDGFTFGIRIGTGETDSPVSPNQTLGAANGAQGGNFSNYAIWLERGFVRYEIGGTPSRDFSVSIGRTDNPFFSPSELIWYDDLGFDGVSASGRYQVSDHVTPFVTAGAFPIFNTELNFSSTRPSKFSSEDKYLFAVQGGSNFTWARDFSSKLAAAYYVFDNVEGRLSSPFVPLTTSDQGNTDDSRPSFAQKGNTYFPIRDILPTVDNAFGTTKQYQYYGLATPFHVIDLAGTLDYAHFDPFHLSLFGEFIKNVAFDYSRINAIAINNLGPDRADGKTGSFAGGDTGWILGIKVGSPAFEKRWDWYAGASYQYEESDATVDGFNDPNFGLGGTNLKGYRLFGAIAISKNVSFFLRWLSANEVAGPAFRNDTLQIDFNTKF
jgi:hypothetical protein